MDIEPRTVTPEQMEEAIVLCRKRVERAAGKVIAAQAEHAAAAASLNAAIQRLADWQAANPDPQRSIFEEITDV
ncbi:hypothetical protein [Sphingobium sp. WCS2017Hpa-17]|uniref:hypothetical protein n=1 Tax=Sphingobium sp. WCS2017Hpa-17 TaxID=3073638 RepID=UPI00288C170A|nr:hypothetical protein [Sphingobium sp. WCS2017Hpa-17]